MREASIMPLAWAAQWLHYAQDLKQRLKAPATIVPIFEQQVKGCRVVETAAGRAQ